MLEPGVDRPGGAAAPSAAVNYTDVLLDRPPHGLGACVCACPTPYIGAFQFRSPSKCVCVCVRVCFGSLVTSHCIASSDVTFVGLWRQDSHAQLPQLISQLCGTAMASRSNLQPHAAQ